MSSHRTRLLLLVSILAASSLQCSKKSAVFDEAAVMERAPERGLESDSETAKAPGTWKRSRVVPNTSKLKIGDDQELEIQKMETRVRIDGFRARVLIDYYFYNPDERQYEGTFKVRLPNEASPYFLAFGQSRMELQPQTPPATDQKSSPAQFMPDQIMAAREAEWTQPKRARIVPREKAAHAYTETVHRRVDPALMEWAGPGMFSARIFPIAPRAVHRVVIGYDANLSPMGDDYLFDIPLPEGIADTDVHVSISRAEGMEPTVEPEGTRQETRQTLRYVFDDPSERRIQIRLKGAGATGLTRADDVGRYFAAQFKPKLPEDVAKEADSDAVFLVDTSLTSNPDRFNIWRKLMKAVLDNNRGRIDRFAVVFFNVESFWWKKTLVENTPENVAALLDYTDTLALEGATDIGQALDRVASRDDLSGADLFLLSDGAVTWGESEPYALSRRLEQTGSALFAYRTGMTGDDTSMLQHLTRESGGAIFSVVGESEIAQASTAHTARPWEIRRVRVGEAEDVLLAGRPATLFNGQRLTVVGRGGLSTDSKIVLELERGSEELEVETSLDRVWNSPLTARTYGQIAVGQLEEFLGSTRRFAEAYARHFRVPGRSSSLLMLESEADYERFDIQPADDASVVQRNRTRILVSNALDELVEKLGDPKAAFIDWTTRASQMPDVHLDLNPMFKRVLDELPEKTFRVVPAPLECESHASTALSDSLKKQLAQQKPDYDTVVADAERRRQKYGTADALKALSSLVEKNPSDGTLARDVGYSASQWGLHGQAYHLFRRVIHSRPWEPQTYHGIARTLADAGRPNLALVYFEVALRGQWHARFGSFRRIVELDYLRFLRGTRTESLHPSTHEFARTRGASLAGSVGIDRADLVVVMSWNTDNTDVDLHVNEPGGARCFYKNPTTKNGGQLTDDVTEGYGPEMYVMENAPEGQYRIRAKYYASNRNRAGTRTKVHVTIYRNWGEVDEEVVQKTVALENGKQIQDIARFEIQK